MVLTGTNFPGNATEIDSVTFAKTDCVVDPATVTNTSVECTLAHEPTCGSFSPVFVRNLGLIPVASGVAEVTVTCTMTTATPNQDLNLLGGDTIDIVGTFLPMELAKSSVDIKFNDNKNTPCVPMQSQSHHMKCETGAFDLTTAPGTTVTPVVTINGQTITNDLTFTLRNEVKSSTGLTPNSASPVLKTPIDVQLETSFPYELKKEDLQMWVYRTKEDNTTLTKQVNVVSVNDTAKSFKVMFGGAESAVFNVKIRHATFGLIKTENMQLTVESRVTAVSPRTASIYGGTIITITGTNFGTVKTDNPVQISYNGGVGSTHCFVLTTMATQITCQLDEIANANGDTGTLIVFLKTSEEAKCADEVCKDFTFTSALPEIKAAVAQWDETSNTWEMKLTGLGLPASTASSSMTIGGKAQTAKSGSSTEAVFTITDADSTTVKAKVYFEQGKPEGHSFLDAGIAITPKFVSVSPNAGSVGGTTIVANVQGAIAGSTLDITDAAGQSICDKVTVPSYGKVVCKTKKQVIASGALKISSGSDTIECASGDNSVCIYEQTEGATFPKVTGAATTGSTIVFSGTSFYTSGYSAVAIFNGIKADTVVANSATSVTATWNLGVPIVANASVPHLFFVQDGATGVEFIATSATVTVVNSLTVASSS